MQHILIAEDDPKIRDIIKTYSAAQGYRITEACNGKEALARLSEATFDAVILDVMMPYIDGWTVLRELRQTSKTPVILLTARGEEYDRLFGFELGVDDYVVKPFSPKELMARLKVVLRRAAPEQVPSQNLAFETLRMDLRARDVFVEDKRLKLTPKEFELLQFLMQNPHKALSRAQILDGVWGVDFYGEERTVDTHVKMLRENLGPLKHWLVTVWGVGYRFEPVAETENEQQNQTSDKEKDQAGET